MSEELEEVVQPEVEQEAEPEESVVEEPVVDKELEARRQLTARAKKAEAEAKVLEAKLKAATGAKPPLDVEDFLDISASLEGLDQREKSYLAEMHKLTGKPLAEIRKDENFGLWQSAYRQKVEKELSLKPSGTQSESDKPMSFSELLAKSSVADKEKILTDAGLYKSPRPRSDRVDLGRGK